MNDLESNGMLELGTDAQGAPMLSLGTYVPGEREELERASAAYDAAQQERQARERALQGLTAYAMGVGSGGAHEGEYEAARQAAGDLAYLNSDTASLVPGDRAQLLGFELTRRLGNNDTWGMAERVIGQLPEEEREGWKQRLAGCKTQRDGEIVLGEAFTALAQGKHASLVAQEEEMQRAYEQYGNDLSTAMVEAVRAGASLTPEMFEQATRYGDAQEVTASLQRAQQAMDFVRERIAQGQSWGAYQAEVKLKADALQKEDESSGWRWRWEKQKTREDFVQQARAELSYSYNFGRGDIASLVRMLDDGSGQLDRRALSAFLLALNAMAEDEQSLESEFWRNFGTHLKDTAIRTVDEMTRILGGAIAASGQYVAVGVNPEFTTFTMTPSQHEEFASQYNREYSPNVEILRDHLANVENVRLTIDPKAGLMRSALTDVGGILGDTAPAIVAGAMTGGAGTLVSAGASGLALAPSLVNRSIGTAYREGKTNPILSGTIDGLWNAAAEGLFGTAFRTIPFTGRVLDYAALKATSVPFVARTLGKVQGNQWSRYALGVVAESGGEFMLEPLIAQSGNWATVEGMRLMGVDLDAAEWNPLGEFNEMWKDESQRYATIAFCAAMGLLGLPANKAAAREFVSNERALLKSGLKPETAARIAGQFNQGLITEEQATTLARDAFREEVTMGDPQEVAARLEAESQLNLSEAEAAVLAQRDLHKVALRLSGVLESERRGDKNVLHVVDRAKLEADRETWEKDAKGKPVVPEGYEMPRREVEMTDDQLLAFMRYGLRQHEVAAMRQLRSSGMMLDAAKRLNESDQAAVETFALSPTMMQSKAGRELIGAAATQAKVSGIMTPDVLRSVSAAAVAEMKSGGAVFSAEAEGGVPGAASSRVPMPGLASVGGMFAERKQVAREMGEGADGTNLFRLNSRNGSSAIIYNAGHATMTELTEDVMESMLFEEAFRRGGVSEDGKWNDKGRAFVREVAAQMQRVREQVMQATGVDVMPGFNAKSGNLMHLIEYFSHFAQSNFYRNAEKFELGEDAVRGVKFVDAALLAADMLKRFDAGFQTWRKSDAGKAWEAEGGSLASLLQEAGVRAASLYREAELTAENAMVAAEARASMMGFSLADVMELEEAVKLEEIARETPPTVPAPPPEMVEPGLELPAEDGSEFALFSDEGELAAPEGAELATDAEGLGNGLHEGRYALMGDGSVIGVAAVADVHLSQDVPQFKRKAGTGDAANEDGTTHKLSGKYRKDAPPITVWRRRDGRLEVITGRHRLAHAKAHGEAFISVRVYDEDAAHDATWAKLYDVEQNILDRQASVQDVAYFFRNTGMTETEAEERGLMPRAESGEPLASGTMGITIARRACDEVYTRFMNNDLTRTLAYFICTLNTDEQGQTLAAQMLKKKKPLEWVKAYVHEADSARAASDAPMQFDLFGMDESWAQEAAKVADYVAKARRQVQRLLSVLEKAGTLRSKAATAAKLGVQLKTDGDVQATQVQLALLDAALERMDSSLNLGERAAKWDGESAVDLAELRMEESEVGSCAIIRRSDGSLFVRAYEKDIEDGSGVTKERLKAKANAMVYKNDNGDYLGIKGRGVIAPGDNQEMFLVPSRIEPMGSTKHVGDSTKIADHTVHFAASLLADELWAVSRKMPTRHKHGDKQTAKQNYDAKNKKNLHIKIRRRIAELEMPDGALYEVKLTGKLYRVHANTLYMVEVTGVKKIKSAGVDAGMKGYSPKTPGLSADVDIATQIEENVKEYDNKTILSPSDRVASLVRQAYRQDPHGHTPKGWYAFGCPGSAVLTHGHVFFLTRSNDEAARDAGQGGEVWYIRKSKDTDSIDVTTAEGRERIVLALKYAMGHKLLPDGWKMEDAVRYFALKHNRAEKEFYKKKDKLTDKFYELFADFFSPQNLREDAGAFAVPELAAWLYEETGAELIITADGAVCLDVTEVDGVRVDEGAESGSLSTVAYTPEMQGIIDKAKADGTYMLAPNGKPTNLTEHQWAQVRTKAFKEWFGDWEDDPKNASKVVDENGEPLVVYHGTHEDFSAFEEGDSWSARAGGAIWFSDNKATAETYGRHGGRVMGIFIKAINPKFVDAKGKTHKEVKVGSRRGTGEIARGVNRKKHDAVIFLNIKDYATLVGEDIPAATSVAVFKPTQIKSATDNRGTFDPQNPDITLSVTTLHAMRAAAGVGAKELAMQAMLRSVEQAGHRWQSAFSGRDEKVSYDKLAQGMGELMGMAMGVYRALPAGYRVRLDPMLRRGAVFARMVEQGKILSYGQVSKEERAALGEAVLEQIAADYPDLKPGEKAAEKRLWKAAMKEATAKVGRAEMVRMYAEIAETAAAAVRKFLKDEELRKLDRFIAMLMPRVDAKTRRMQQSKLGVEVHQEVERLVALMEMPEEARAARQQELEAAMELAEKEGDDVRGVELAREYADLQAFGALRSRGYEEIRAGRTAFMALVATGATPWQRKLEREKNLATAVRLRVLSALGSPDEQSTKEMKEKHSRSLWEKLKALPAYTMSIGQLMDSMGAIPGLGAFAEESRDAIVQGHKSLVARQNDLMDGMGAFMVRELGLDTDAKRADFMVRLKENVATGIVPLPDRAVYDERVPYEVAAEWAAMSAAEREAARKAWDENPEGLRVAPEAAMPALRDALVTAEPGGKVHVRAEYRQTAEKRPLVISRDQALNIVLLCGQERYRANAEAHGYTEEVLQQLREFCGADVLRLGDWMRVRFNRSGVKEAFESREGVPFPAEPNYWPGNFDLTSRMDEGKNALEQAGQAAGSRYGMLKTRVNHNLTFDLSLGATNAFMAGMAMGDNYICFGGLTRKWRSLLHNDVFARRLREYLGAGRFSALKDGLNMLDCQGVMEAFAQRTMSSLISRVQSAHAPAVLAGSVTTMVKQVSALLHGAAFPGVSATRLIGQLIADRSGAGRMTYGKMMREPIFSERSRHAGSNVWEEMLALGADVKWSRLAAWSRCGMNALERIDTASNCVSMTALYNVLWSRAEKEARENGVPLDEAATHERCMRAVELTLEGAAMPVVKSQRSLLQACGGQGVWGALNMYMSGEVLNKVGCIVSKWHKGGGGWKSFKAAMPFLVTMSMSQQALCMLIDLLRGKAPDDEDEWLMWLGCNLFTGMSGMGLLNGVPVVGDFVTFASQGYLRTNTMAEVLGLDVFNGAKRVYRMATDDKEHSAAEWAVRGGNLLRLAPAGVGLLGGGVYSTVQWVSHATGLLQSASAAYNAVRVLPEFFYHAERRERKARRGRKVELPRL